MSVWVISKKVLLTLAFVFGLAVTAFAQPTVVTSASGGSSSSTTATTTSFTVSGTNTFLICTVATQDINRTGQSVVMSNGSTALTVLDVHNFDNSGLQARVEVWALVAPPAGSTTVTVTLNGVTAVAIGCAQLSGVDQSTPIGTLTANGGSSNTSSVTTASATGELAMDFLSLRTGTVGITEGSGQTNLVEKQSGTGAGQVTVAMSSKAGASSVNLTWTVDDATVKSWSVFGASIKPAAGGGGTPVPRGLLLVNVGGAE